ncbi:MAG: response regulator transcription factor [Thermoflavifilum sp.]|nr:response regulator transcription factor [Thermoflavifilum sp.]MCL6514515.1 response regulator transcription factor [Alicyclobacillus sp.]
MIRVLIADDQRLMREGLRTLLALEQDIEVAGLAADGVEAVQMVAAGGIDVVLMDIRMPSMDGIEAVREIRRRGLPVRVLMLTTYDDQADIVAALHAGASGYLLKDMAAEDIAEAIRTAHAGGAVLPPRVASVYLEAMRSGDGARAGQAETGAAEGDKVHHPRAAEVTGGAEDSGAPLEPLTEREQEVLRCLARGLSNREIAERLHVTEGTVKNHVSSIINKLGLRDRTQAALYAVRHGYDA